MNVLSLFDGMSCGQLALQRAGIEYKNYFASEIDKYAIAVTQSNFPKTIQLGDINNWKNWDLPQIDLILAGSPCQGFSNAGNRLNFEHPKSKLFFVFVEILKYYKPKYFLLENVKMKKEWETIITDYIGVEPIMIDSALVSAQTRKRLYWTNIPGITQPEDKNILLKDVIEYGEADKNKSYTVIADFFPEKQVVTNAKQKKLNGKALTYNEHRLQIKLDPRKQLLEKIDEIDWGNWKTRNCWERIIKNVRCIDQKACPCTVRMNNPNNNGTTVLFYDDLSWRILTPLECERLQTVPDNYTLVPHPSRKGKMMSNTQRYKMLGNGWTVDVIAHILSFIKE